MIKSISDIEALLAVPDKGRRINALKQAAVEIGALEPFDPHTGRLNEQQLVIALYDGLIIKKQEGRRNRKFIILTVCGFTAAVMLAVLIPQASIRQVRLIRARHENRTAAYQGFDEHGELLRDEEGRPVLFRDMEGLYDEYYDDGKIHFEYRYSGGKIVEQKEYDRRGNLTAHLVFDADGNPRLIAGQ